MVLVTNIYGFGHQYIWFWSPIYMVLVTNIYGFGHQYIWFCFKIIRLNVIMSQVIRYI